MNRTRFSRSLILSAIVASATLVVGALLVSVPPRSPPFWYRLGWFEFLVLANAWAIAQLKAPSGERVGATARRMPALVVIVGAASLVSFAVESASLVLSASADLQRWHLAAQVLIFGVTAVATISIFAVPGEANAPLTSDSPRQIAQRLNALKHQLAYSDSISASKDVSDALDRLRDRLTYAIGPGAEQAATYPEFVRGIGDLEARLLNQGLAEPLNDASYDAVRRQLDRLRATAEALVTAAPKRPS